MSADEPHPPGGLTPPVDPENSLDELLDSVRDHLEEPSTADDDIPVLTDIVVAAQPAATGGTNLDMAENRPGLGATATTPADDTFNIDEPAADHLAEQEFDVTQVASLDDDLDRSFLLQTAEDNAPAVAEAEIDSGNEQNQAQVPGSQTTTAELAQDPENTDSAGAQEDGGAEFDVTQVASMADDPSDTRPVAPAPRSSELPADEPAFAGEDNDGMQQTLLNAGEFEYSSTMQPSPLESAANSTANQAFDESQIATQWLERFDRVIDERCQALAEELKRQLRQSVEVTDPNTDHDLSD